MGPRIWELAGKRPRARGDADLARRDAHNPARCTIPSSMKSVLHLAGRPARRANAAALARASARAISSKSSAQVLALGGNLASAADVQDLVISYGVKNAAVPDVVRPLVVVKVGGEVITKEPENLVASLRFLYNFGLQVRGRR